MDRFIREAPREMNCVHRRLEEPFTEAYARSIGGLLVREFRVTAAVVAAFARRVSPPAGPAVD